MNQNQLLETRRVIYVTGEDAESFLQNIFTNDIRLVEDGLQYNLLLTPQGQVLHDVFIFRHDVGFCIDVENTQMPDLLKRLGMFKLRAKVEIKEIDLKVVAGDKGLKDPRHKDLGCRSYQPSALFEGEGYEDLCISLGIPNGTKTIRYGKDFAHDVNLDLLNAISWTKGCFIGQEVAARVYNRGLAKKRLMILRGSGLEPEGDIRQVSSDKCMALAVIRLDNLPENVKKPDYLNT